jgi:hypothetical protein
MAIPKRLVAAAAAIALVPSVGAFVAPSGRLAHAHSKTNSKTHKASRSHSHWHSHSTMVGCGIGSPTSLAASTLENPSVATTNSTTTTIGTISKPVSGSDTDGPRTSLDVRIHGVWYDLTGT